MDIGTEGGADAPREGGTTVAAAPASPLPPAPSPFPRSRNACDARTRKFITAALLLVMVLVSMEMTITSTAMPSIIGELHGLEHYSWVASIYLLAATVTMPLYGRMADAWGRKRVLLASIVLFCGGSLL